jgi:hypothetical protein
VDLGQRYSASVVIDNGQSHRQAFWSISELSGRSPQNRVWLQQRKSCNVFDIGSTKVDILSSKQPSLEEYLRHVQSALSNGVLGSLLWFYGQKATIHRAEDSRMSTTAALDRSVAGFLKAAESRLIVAGDAQFDATVEGQPASKHERWLRTLLRHVKEK